MMKRYSTYLIYIALMVSAGHCKDRRQVPQGEKSSAPRSEERAPAQQPAPVVVQQPPEASAPNPELALLTNLLKEWRTQPSHTPNTVSKPDASSKTEAAGKSSISDEADAGDKSNAADETDGAGKSSASRTPPPSRIPRSGRIPNPSHIPQPRHTPPPSRIPRSGRMPAPSRIPNPSHIPQPRRTPPPSRIPNPSHIPPRRTPAPSRIPNPTYTPDPDSESDREDSASGTEEETIPENGAETDAETDNESETTTSSEENLEQRREKLAKELEEYLNAPLEEHTYPTLQALLAATEATLVDIARMDPATTTDTAPDELEELKETLAKHKKALIKEHLLWQEAMDLREGKDLHEPDAKGRHALHYLAGSKPPFSTHHSQLFDFVIAHTQDFNVLSEGPQGQTALQYALSAGNQVAIDKLLKQGADVERRDKQGETALATAIATKQKALIELILAQKADPYALNKDGISLVSQAIEEIDEGLVKVLLSQGAPLKKELLPEAMNQGLHNLASWLVGKGIDVNGRGKRGETALILAASAGMEQMVQTLLEKGADVDIQATGGGFSRYYKDIRGWTAFHGAIDSGNYQLAYRVGSYARPTSYSSKKAMNLHVTLALSNGIYVNENPLKYAEKLKDKLDQRKFDAVLIQVKWAYGMQ